MRDTELARTHHYKNTLRSEFTPASHHQRQPFHHARTSPGAAGHLLHMGIVAAPLVIGELIHDSDKRWRAMRLVPVVGALASEALWMTKIAHDRKREQEDHAALDACYERCH